MVQWYNQEAPVYRFGRHQNRSMSKPRSFVLMHFGPVLSLRVYSSSPSWYTNWETRCSWSAIAISWSKRSQILGTGKNATSQCLRLYNMCLWLLDAFWRIQLMKGLAMELYILPIFLITAKVVSGVWKVKTSWTRSRTLRELWWGQKWSRTLSFGTKDRRNGCVLAKRNPPQNRGALSHAWSGLLHLFHSDRTGGLLSTT